MVCTVMGKLKKPYDVDGNKGISYRVSLFCGQYESDSFTGAVGEGDSFIEVKCPSNFFDKLVVNNEYRFDLDDRKTRVKDVLGIRSDGSLFSLV